MAHLVMFEGLFGRPSHRYIVVDEISQERSTVEERSGRNKSPQSPFLVRGTLCYVRNEGAKGLGLNSFHTYPHKTGIESLYMTEGICYVISKQSPRHEIIA
jgi:hypothetical protein